MVPSHSDARCSPLRVTLEGPQGSAEEETRRSNDCVWGQAASPRPWSRRPLEATHKGVVTGLGAKATEARHSEGCACVRGI